MKKRSGERKFCLSVYSHVMFQNFFSLRFTFLPCPQWWQVVKCQISERCSEGAATRQKGRPSEENQIKCQLYLFSQQNSRFWLQGTQLTFRQQLKTFLISSIVSNNWTNSFSYCLHYAVFSYQCPSLSSQISSKVCSACLA